MCAKHQQRRELRRHLRTIESIEETEATIDFGAAMLRVPTMCTDVPIRQCPESWRGMMLRTASGQLVAHEGIRTSECTTDDGFTRRLARAVTSAQKILLAVSRLAETGHQVQFTWMHCE